MSLWPFQPRRPTVSAPADASKTCLTTVLNDAFTEYFLVFYFSIKKYNSAFHFPVVIQHSPALSPLSEASQGRIRRAIPTVQFRLMDEKPYERFFGVTPERLHAALLKLETFHLTDFDHVVFLDSDMLCLGDLSLLFHLHTDFAAVSAGKNRELKEKIADTFRRRTGFNSGVMVIGKKYLDGTTYAKLLQSKIAPCPTADQDILNRFFRFSPVFCLDHRYNYHAQFFWSGTETDVKILHYAGTKPLEEPDASRMRVWFEHQKEMQKAGW